MPGESAVIAFVRRHAGSSGPLRYQLLAAVAGSAGLKLGGLATTAIVAVLLARLLGPEGYGLYSYALAWATMLGIPVQFGIPTLVVREVARLRAYGQWNLVRGLLRLANILVVIATAAIIAAVAGWRLLHKGRSGV